MTDINFETDVTKQMFEVVAEALLYKEDAKDGGILLTVNKNRGIEQKD